MIMFIKQIFFGAFKFPIKTHIKSTYCQDITV